jgi:undecaprenyl-diphosphatase
MTILDAIILGFVQGASEFLPISSSAHLVIGQGLLGVHEPSIFLEVALHVGTLFSVLIYFWRDIVQLISGFVKYLTMKAKTPFLNDFKTSLYIIIGSIPAGIAGLLFKDWFEAKFKSPAFCGYMLLITAVVLLLTRFVRTQNRPVNGIRALLVGVAQAVAILPGISRSGSTIATGLFLGITPTLAARFSFLLSLPAVAGASILKFSELAGSPLTSGDLIDFGIGALVSFVVGMAAIHYLLKLIAGRKFYLFGFYCLLVGVFTVLYF